MSQTEGNQADVHLSVNNILALVYLALSACSNRVISWETGEGCFFATFQVLQTTVFLSPHLFVSVCSQWV